jgi:hypothetical protein
MLSINFKSLRRFFSAVLAVCLCAFVFVTSVQPAFATTSKPSEGEANLTEIERKSQEAVQSDPYSLGKTQDETNPGLNEVQGTADIDKMKRPDNTNATSFEEQVKETVDKITGKSK